MCPYLYTVFGTFWFGGNKGKGLVNLIDTMGSNNPNNNADIKIIAELVSALKNEADYVNLFTIAVNRLSKSYFFCATNISV